MKEVDLLIIGGGPAGLAAAVRAKEKGIDNLLIVERNAELGGILNQCIHNGFGLHIFKEELTGPEYAHRFREQARALSAAVMLGAMTLSISPDKVANVLCEDSVARIRAKAVILAMGCRERPRGAINIPGSRPAGIFTAGAAQDYVNMKGFMPGRRVVILGSGDIGLIMARRMTLEGARVECVLEIMPYSAGLKRNIVQCLEDYEIPLKLKHTVTNIYGDDRLTGVEIAQVDDAQKPIDSTRKRIDCDTLLLSVGLIPENELSKNMGVRLSAITGGAIVDSSYMTSVDGVFACGNALHVHDLVDNVTLESFRAADGAVDYIMNGLRSGETVNIEAGNGIRYTVPSFIRAGETEDVAVLFRTNGVFKDCNLCVYAGERLILKKKKRIMTPGEMEKITLSAGQYAGAVSICIAVERESV